MNIDKVCKQISKELDIPYETIKDVVMYEFKFTVKTMKDPEDTRDILFNKLFKFKLKNRFKDDKTKNYSPNEDNINRTKSVMGTV